MGASTANLREHVTQFFGFVDKEPGEDGHWIWRGARGSNDYGRFGTKTTGNWLPHNFAWQLDNGPVPEGRRLTKVCTVPFCIKPGHWVIDPLPARAARKKQGLRRKPLQLTKDGKAPDGPSLVWHENLNQALGERLDKLEEFFRVEVRGLSGRSDAVEARLRAIEQALANRDGAIFDVLERLRVALLDLGALLEKRAEPAPPPAPLPPPPPAPPPDEVAPPPPPALRPTARDAAEAALSPLASVLLKAFRDVGGIVVDVTSDADSLCLLFDKFLVLSQGDAALARQWTLECLVEFGRNVYPALTVSDFSEVCSRRQTTERQAAAI